MSGEDCAVAQSSDSSSTQKNRRRAPEQHYTGEAEAAPRCRSSGHTGGYGQFDCHTPPTWKVPRDRAPLTALCWRSGSSSSVQASLNPNRSFWPRSLFGRATETSRKRGRTTMTLKYPNLLSPTLWRLEIPARAGLERVERLAGAEPGAAGSKHRRPREQGEVGEVGTRKWVEEAELANGSGQKQVERYSDGCAAADSGKETQRQDQLATGRQ
ncbi:hypothetical protein B0H13DRAFT_1854929 [Mycena leptocephala]|nr:hypothetical protein B0H13DRAFT_1854929 [Mycena leptocephala]